MKLLLPRTAKLRARLLSLSIVLGLCLSFSAQAKADSFFFMTLSEEGNDVVASGSGDFDLTGLVSNGGVSNNPSVSPAFGFILSGSLTTGELYFGINVPGSFGTGRSVDATTESGDVVGVAQGYDSDGDLIPGLIVPTGYTSGMLNTSLTFSNASFDSLGITPGTYTWTWDGGADEFLLDVGAIVPEPSQYGFLAVLAFAGLLTWRRFSPRLAVAIQRRTTVPCLR